MDKTDLFAAEKKVRCFVGTILTAPLQSAIQAHIQPLLNYYPPAFIKWIDADQLHLTLRFLGATATSLLPLLAISLATIAKNQQAFPLRLKNLTYFPSPMRPQIIVLETDLPQELKTLVGKIEAEMVRLGFNPEQRTFKGHITLARLKKRIPLCPALQALNQVMRIEKIALLQSQTLPQGARYKILTEYELGKAS